jgi:hypothetical protein
MDRRLNRHLDEPFYFSDHWSVNNFQANSEVSPTTGGQNEPSHQPNRNTQPYTLEDDFGLADAANQPANVGRMYERSHVYVRNQESSSIPQVQEDWTMSQAAMSNFHYNMMVGFFSRN